jgi:hypothetical protein
LYVHSGGKMTQPADYITKIFSSARRAADAETVADGGNSSRDRLAGLCFFSPP